eukprot:TRINITY_DN8514_c0_g1_i2.p1 TRINITY_DN8514_c0_g1~~TRINITY_DN8514_c0_g1_i2.p1  ORF type:complete len:133 (-),score=21.41 TRINITY_DN8514_c0_g1_i2:35-433(-)
MCIRDRYMGNPTFKRNTNMKNSGKSYEMVNADTVLITHQHLPRENLNQHEPNLILHSSLGKQEPNLKVDKLWEGKKYILHKVEITDTLMGLSLRYNVPAPEIRKANNLSTDDVYFLKAVSYTHLTLPTIYSV